MKPVDFVPEVKDLEGETFVVLNDSYKLGIERKNVMIHIPPGAGLEKAREVAKALRGLKISIG